ncbi:BET1-like protein [Cryptotermes secundus]|uniref:BET1 homolog n=1 Tax=Cryptotermes secundus TaxID=105785 RepID=A0A2J7QFJ2_9NEOP|nr:BET1-like protein [Cryptotermes secundus]
MVKCQWMTNLVLSPSTARTHENVEKIREIIKEDRRRTIEEIVELSGVTWSSVQRILTEDLGMKRVAAKFVSRLLTAEQKQGRVEACCALKEESRNDQNFFLFPRMKRDMNGKRFADVAEVKKKTTEALSSISKDEFRQCFEKWNKRLDKCISFNNQNTYCDGGFRISIDVPFEDDPMRRANGSGHYYQPLSQYSDQDTVEQQNDALADELKGKVQMLKSLSLNIGDEVKYQDRLLREVDDDFEKTGGFLGNTMGRVLRISKGRHNYYILYLFVFAIFVFFILYLVIKFR